MGYMKVCEGYTRSKICRDIKRVSSGNQKSKQKHTAVFMLSFRNKGLFAPYLYNIIITDYNCSKAIPIKDSRSLKQHRIFLLANFFFAGTHRLGVRVRRIIDMIKSFFRESNLF